MSYFDEQGCFLLAVNFQSCNCWKERKGGISRVKKRLWGDHKIDGTTPVWVKYECIIFLTWCCDRVKHISHAYIMDIFQLYVDLHVILVLDASRCGLIMPSGKWFCMYGISWYKPWPLNGKHVLWWTFFSSSNYTIGRMQIKANFHVIGVWIFRWRRHQLWLLVQRGTMYSRFCIMRYYAYESGAMEAWREYMWC
jgi:hypothetical protein